MPNIYNQVKTAFRFYTKEIFQTAYSDVCEDVRQDEWLLFNDVVMPFQIRCDNGTGAVTSILLYDVNIHATNDITADLIGDTTVDSGVDIEGELYDFITYQPDSETYVITPGLYYLIVTTASQTYYSEYFEMVCEDIADEIKLMEQLLSGSGNLIAEPGVHIKITNNII